MHDPAAAGPPPEDGAGHDGPWQQERQARSWWTSSDDRDARAEEADRRADQRDTTARGRDDTADQGVLGARDREALAYQRIREVTRRLNAQDADEADQHLHLQLAAEAIQEAIDSGADEPLLHLLRRVLELLDVQVADVLAAGVQRSALRVDLQHAGQLLAGAADDRTTAASDRSAAASDRSAAAGDRDSARTARQQAAAYRGLDDPGSPAP
ncbi:hypothetical protein GCM10028783_24990 [Modestobacter muralis]